MIQNPLFIETFSAMGVSAQPMPFPEVYTALETGVVDGQENPLATILASKFYEVQDYTVMSNHIYSVWALLMGKKFWDKLSPDEQQLITAAAKEATAFERETIRAFSTKAKEELESEGMEITELPEAELTKLREITKPVVDQFTQQFGQAEAARDDGGAEVASAAYLWVIRSSPAFAISTSVRKCPLRGLWHTLSITAGSSRVVTKAWRMVLSMYMASPTARIVGS